MKILLPAVASSCNPDGVSRHAVNLAQCLLLNEEIEHVDLIVGEWQCDAVRSMLNIDDRRFSLLPIAMWNSSWTRNRWYWTHLPKAARRLKSDLVHATYPVPLNRSAFPCPLVVTLHDLYPYDAPTNFGYPKVFVNRAILKQCLRAADAIACVSKTTLSRLGVYATDEVIQKSVTVYNYVAARAEISIESPVRDWQGEPFLLCIAQHRQNKNILLSIKIFQELRRMDEVAANARLVIIGEEGPESAGIYQFVREVVPGNSVVFLRGISDVELSWCYRHCEFLLVPSVAEGFGLPVVEAMMHQCNVVCSDIPIFREIGANYCYYAGLQPDPLGNFVEASRRALRNHKFRSAPTACFNKANIAEAYLRLYMRLCSTRPSIQRCDGSIGVDLVQERKQ